MNIVTYTKLTLTTHNFYTSRMYHEGQIQRKYHQYGKGLRYNLKQSNEGPNNNQISKASKLKKIVKVHLLSQKTLATMKVVDVI